MQKMACFCRKTGRDKFKKTKTKRFPSRKPLLDLVEVTGFEPATFWSRTKRATKLRYTSIYGANEGTRTPDLLITNRLLYQLSHIGITRLHCRRHLRIIAHLEGNVQYCSWEWQYLTYSESEQRAFFGKKLTTCVSMV